jgi:hypothetical protein
MQIAWVLNLDADDELRNPLGYAPPAATARRTEALIPHLRGLVREGDVVLGHAPQPLRGAFVGQAWCPTPRALALLQEAGARIPATPPLDVLRRVNHRGFCAGLGQTLEAARWVESLDELRDHIATHRASSEWVLKRAFGFSGRGSRRLRAPEPTQQDLEWIAATFRREPGMQLEPWVIRERDFVIHGYIEASKRVHWGCPTVQECNEKGAWVHTRPVLESELSASEHETLHSVAASTAQALVDARYFGPFGIDAYRWVDDAGVRRFNPRSEVNARYTMGWHVGMGEWRPRLEPDANGG